jgi:hypothetical protein
MIATHRHKKSGNLYQYLFVANRQAIKTGFPETVIYLDSKGSIWALKGSDFREKFESLEESENIRVTNRQAKYSINQCISSSKGMVPESAKNILAMDD